MIAIHLLKQQGTDIPRYGALNLVLFRYSAPASFFFNGNTYFAVHSSFEFLTLCIPIPYFVLFYLVFCFLEPINSTKWGMPV
jgi:hypothetical protein